MGVVLKARKLLVSLSACIALYIYCSRSQLGSIVFIFTFCSFGPVPFNRKQVRKCNPKVTLRRVHATIVAVEKRQLLHILTIFVTLFIQQAIRMRHIVIRGLL